MRPRDLTLFAQTRLQLQRARIDATSRGDARAVERLDAQLNQHPYNHRSVVVEADRLLRPRTPVDAPITVIDRVRGRARG